MPKPNKPIDSIRLPDATVMISVSCLAPDPQGERGRHDERSTDLVRALIREHGFASPHFLIVVENNRSKSGDEKRYHVVDGKARFVAVRDERDDITELPCKVMACTPTEARQFVERINTPVQGASKTSTLGELLVEALAKAHRTNDGKSIDLCEEVKERIRLITRGRDRSHKTINRAAATLRKILYALNAGKPLSEIDVLETFTTATEAGVPAELHEFVHGGSAHGFLVRYAERIAGETQEEPATDAPATDAPATDAAEKPTAEQVTTTAAVIVTAEDDDTQTIVEEGAAELAAFETYTPLVVTGDHGEETHAVTPLADDEARLSPVRTEFGVVQDECARDLAALLTLSGEEPLPPRGVRRNQLQRASDDLASKYELRRGALRNVARLLTISLNKPNGDKPEEAKAVETEPTSSSLPPPVKQPPMFSELVN